ncbi:MAG: hypothetical protein KatS3mg113_0410 [Planctomycetaceae bacterium]|nr:MAG: hypothetical protein KatS3mg113_0410 [Planctomycetaceae bacterium]
MPKRSDSQMHKPPQPARDPADWDAWIEQVVAWVQPIVRYADALIRREIPDVYYGIKWAQAHYGTPAQGWIIELAAYRVSVNLVFYSGADFKPPPPLGTKGRSRYVKVHSLAEVQSPQIADWIRQAAQITGWKPLI